MRFHGNDERLEVTVTHSRVQPEDPTWTEATQVKTQLAVAAADGLLRSGGIELLVWITATSRASVLAGYVEASVAALGVPPAGDSEPVRASLARIAER